MRPSEGSGAGPSAGLGNASSTAGGGAVDVSRGGTDAERPGGEPHASDAAMTTHAIRHTRRLPGRSRHIVEITSVGRIMFRPLLFELRPGSPKLVSNHQSRIPNPEAQSEH